MVIWGVDVKSVLEFCCPHSMGCEMGFFSTSSIDQSGLITQKSPSMKDVKVRIERDVVAIARSRGVSRCGDMTTAKAGFSSRAYHDAA